MRGPSPSLASVKWSVHCRRYGVWSGSLHPFSGSGEVNEVNEFRRFGGLHLARNTSMKSRASFRVKGSSPFPSALLTVLWRVYTQSKSDSRSSNTLSVRAAGDDGDTFLLKFSLHAPHGRAFQKLLMNSMILDLSSSEGVGL